MKDKQTAALLALVPGILGLCTGGSLGLLNGLHYIYIGGRFSSKGVTWLILSIACDAIALSLCWLFIPLVLLVVPFVLNIMCIIDAIKIFGMSDEQFQSEYGQ